MELEGRLVEVEAYVDHDAVMDCWPRLEAGMALLASTHDLLRPLEVGEEGRRPRFALPVAMARQPLSSIGGWVARLDDQAVARRHAAGVGPELAAARRLMLGLGRWQDAFA
jgi:hypothetical protein